MPANRFVWYELMTSDPEAMERFYANVVGWTPELFSAEPRYTLMKAGAARVAGVMPLPEDFVKAGGHPCWVGYIGVADVDAATRKLKAAGGAVHREPSDIPEVGRFSVIADPQGAMFMLFQPQAGGTPPPPVAAGTPGHGGWRELYAADWQKAFDFYSGQFGWTKDRAVDMGEMGIYQTFAADGAQIGGMMNKPAQIPRPVWQYYFNVPGIDAAAQRVKAGGGAVLMGPHEVPGGSWIVNCTDPQGAHFALVSATK
jgi:predicted enzyme related to lactoylglutathione lyase